MADVRVKLGREGVLVDVSVVGQHALVGAHRELRVLVGGGRIVIGYRRVVDRGYRDRDGSSGTVIGTVVGLKVEGVGPVEVGLGGVGNLVAAQGAGGRDLVRVRVLPVVERAVL